VQEHYRCECNREEHDDDRGRASESEYQVSDEKQIEVTIRYRDVEKTVTGNPEGVFRSVFQFLSETIPALDVISKITLTVNFADFLKEAAGVFAVTPEGVVVLTPPEALTDRELVLLFLVRAKVSYETGKSEKETLLASELISFTGKGSGTVAGRLSELSGEGLVERTGKGEYRVTTFGLHRFQQDVLPKLKS
jgi:predicted  nucleic acid-binding Zn-ribbon protein